MSEAVKKALEHPNKLGAGAAKREHLAPKEHKQAVYAEFHRGTLHSGSGEIVTNPKQAAAIAHSESGDITPKEKRGVVMSEFHKGNLHSSSGKKVTNPAQAAAIAYSESERVSEDINVKEILQSKFCRG